MVKINGNTVPSPVPAQPKAPQARNTVVPPRTQPAQTSSASSFEAPRLKAPVALQTAAPLQVTGKAPIVTPADVDQIAAMTDPVARNYAITQGYADIASQTADLLGKENANWCTFGVWASRQAGTSIRGEDLPKFMVDALHAMPGLAAAEGKLNAHLKSMGLPQLPAFPDLLLKSDAAQRQLCASLGEGNKIVFAEIGREFAQFNQTFRGDTSYDQAKVDAYLSHFTPDQAQLKQGFAAYAKAMFEADPKKKAELMLLGNDLIGADEQARLQDHIETAMNAPDGVFHEAIQGALDKITNHLPWPLKWFAKKELNHFGGVDKLTQLADGAFRKAATGIMMRLGTPTENFKLGEDLPSPAGLGTPFPKDLMDIQDPELQQVLAQLDHSPNSLKGTGATDWSNYAQRMDFIGDLFRSRQQDQTLWDPPFATRPPSPTSAALVA
jgi:hypothetical protein